MLELALLGPDFFFELRAMAQNKSKSQHERLADGSSQAEISSTNEETLLVVFSEQGGNVFSPNQAPLKTSKNGGLKG